MKKYKKSAAWIVSVLLFSLLLSLLSLSASAASEDYSRPGTTAKESVDAAGILEILADELSISLTEAEKKYLSLYGDVGFSYGAHIPSVNLKLEYDAEKSRLGVFATEYSYKTAKGLTVVWTPVRAVLDGDAEKALSENGDKYEAFFDSVSESSAEEVKVYYKTDIVISEKDVNFLINKAYTDAVLWEKYEQYTQDYQAYEASLTAYREYLISKSVYDEELSEYRIYLAELEVYNTENEKYSAYLGELEAYKAAYAEYLKYLSDLTVYNEKLAAYEEYLLKLDKVTRHLAIIDGTKRYATSLGRSVYAAIIGGTVTEVIANKDLIANEVTGAEGLTVDMAGDATTSLRELYAAYFSFDTDSEKYTYYAVNYESFRDSFVNLLRSLDKLYGNPKVRLALEEKGLKEKYEILLAELFYVANAISDTPVINYDGNAYFDSAYRINRKTPLSILENEPYMLDTNDSAPVVGGYPYPIEKPSITEIPEPSQPEAVQKPTAPKEVPDPGEAPPPVSKPIIPEKVDPPWSPSDSASLPEAVTEIIADYKSGALVIRPEVSGNKTVFAEIYVSKKIFNSKEAFITFHGCDGEEIHSTVASLGSYAEFTGTVPEKQEDAAASYTFVGWVDSDGADFDITNVDQEGNIDLYPKFQPQPKTYPVKWIVGDEEWTVLTEYGRIPEFPYIPEKKPSGDSRYTFSGWNKELKAVSGKAAEDTYIAVFKESYIVPFSVGGGAAIKFENGVYTVDCSLSRDMRLNIAEIIALAAENGSVLIKNPYFTVEISYSNVMLLKELSVKEISVFSIQTGYGYSFKVDFLSESNEPVQQSVPLKITLPYSFPNMEGLSVFHESEGIRYPEKASFGEKSMSLAIISSTLYNAINEYAVTLLPVDSSVHVSVDTELARVGDRVRVSKSAAPGIEIKSVYYVTSDGERTEITGGSFLMPAKSVMIGVEYRQIEYTVSFVTDGRIISTRVYKYGEIPELPANPKKAADSEFTYNFLAWSEPISEVRSSKIYTALYTKTPIPKEDKTDELIITPSAMKTVMKIAVLLAYGILILVPVATIFTVLIIIRIRRSPLKKMPKKE